MKAKNVLLGIFSFLTFATYAQTAETTSAVTKFKIETENFEELENFDWEIINEIFQENDKDQEISLVFAYHNNDKTKKSGTIIENIELKAGGTTAELAKLTSGLRNSIEQFAQLKGSAAEE